MHLEEIKALVSSGAQRGLYLEEIKVLVPALSWTWWKGSLSTQGSRKCISNWNSRQHASCAEMYVHSSNVQAVAPLRLALLALP